MNEPKEAQELAIRKRRALYRATHRGTKEMDWMLGRYASSVLENMTETELTEFEQFLAVSDPELEAWIMRGEGDFDGSFKPWISRLRQFHGLDENP